MHLIQDPVKSLGLKVRSLMQRCVFSENHFGSQRPLRSESNPSLSGLLLNAVLQSGLLWAWQGQQCPLWGTYGWSSSKQGTAALTGVQWHGGASQDCGFSAVEWGCQPSSSQPTRGTADDNGHCLENKTASKKGEGKFVLRGDECFGLSRLPSFISKEFVHSSSVRGCALFSVCARAAYRLQRPSSVRLD